MADSDVVLVEMRAGKMNFDGKKVAPDNRQGLLTARLKDEDVLEICWREISAQTDELVISVASDEGTFERVHAAKTGRVYVLKIENDRKFFWSQETDEAKEEELIVKFNAVLAGDLSAVIGNHEEFLMHHQPDHLEPTNYQPLGQWPEISSMPVSGEGEGAGEDGVTQNELLQWMLQQISDQQEDVSLDSLITRDVLEDLITSDQQISDQLKDLLPEGQSIRDCLLSPQFKQALRNFGLALDSEEGAEILYATLGLEPAEGDEQRSPVEAFLHALIRKGSSF